MKDQEFLIYNLGMRLSSWSLGLTSFNRMDIFEIWALQMSHNWRKDIFAAREENYGEVAAVNETLSSTGQILLGLNYSVQKKRVIIWEYLWRFFL